jgi:bifunctional NMN adenylyltransferase/nudix hydrolase
MAKYDYAVFIGRFSPLHNGHVHVINEALAVAKRVIIVLGSAYAPRSYRNPFTIKERAAMIRGAFPNHTDRIYIEYTEDSIYNDTAWVERIQGIVSRYTAEGDKITLIGHEKDHSSFYLKLFPQWDNVSVGNLAGINSTDIREQYFTETFIPFPLPTSVRDFLAMFIDTETYVDICKEYLFIKEYKKAWDAAPYPPTFVTVDACVVQSGHILLVQRGARPGKGLWALPGGFINQYEKVENAVIRELREETKIKVPAPVLKGNIVTSKVFDDPHRSSRGRTITHAFLIHLPPDTSLPKVKGSDDAAYAKWFPLADVERDMMFEDHLDIIRNLTAML